MLNVLRTLLENLECFVLAGFYHHDLGVSDLMPYDGIITILPLETYPNLLQTLILSGKPYTGLSLKHSLINTVFVQIQTGLLEMSYYLFNHQIRSLFISRIQTSSRLERYLFLQ